MLLLQVTSFFWVVYLDSIFLPEGVIAFFFDEYWSSWTAWLGCLLVASLIYLEKAVLDAIRLLRKLEPSCEQKYQKKDSERGMLSSNKGVRSRRNIRKVQHRNSVDDVHRELEVTESVPKVPMTMTKSGSKDSMIHKSDHSRKSSSKQNNKDDKQLNIETN